MSPSVACGVCGAAGCSLLHLPAAAAPCPGCGGWRCLYRDGFAARCRSTARAGAKVFGTLAGSGGAETGFSRQAGQGRAGQGLGSRGVRCAAAPGQVLTCTFYSAGVVEAGQGLEDGVVHRLGSSCLRTQRQCRQGRIRCSRTRGIGWEVCLQRSSRFACSSTAGLLAAQQLVCLQHSSKCALGAVGGEAPFVPCTNGSVRGLGAGDAICSLSLTLSSSRRRTCCASALG